MAEVAALKQDVAALALPLGRTVGSPGHDRARRWLTRRLEAIGCVPYAGTSFELPYGGSGEATFCNVVGCVPGRDRAAAPVLLGAHYDSVIEAPCADDNAAAVAIALAVAETAAAAPLERDLVVALFDAEEPPHFLSPRMGSLRFYEDQRDARGTHAAIIMDLVGHELELPGLEGLLVACGFESSRSLPGVLERCERPPELQVVLARHEAVGDLSDHHAFRLGGTPYVFLTCGRWRHYHQVSDTPERLAWRKMARVCGYVEQLARELAGAALDRRPAGDTTAVEIWAFEAALGRALPLWLERLGLRQLRTRRDLDQLASTLKALGV